MNTLRRTLPLTLALLLAAPALAQTDVALPPPAQTTGVPQLTAGVRRTVLHNGLTVLTKEVHGAPVVSLRVEYKIGSRNEAPGVNGIAHQLEHMMFKGTTDRPVQFGRLLSALGADFNATTSYDQTSYFETVEREKLGAALALEADRMVNAAIDPEKLSSERSVVLSEIEGDENSPDYRLNRAVQAAAFPNSPYGLTVGGTRADIQGFSADKVRAYYQQYYAPEYATLVIVGDFNTNEVLKTVQDAFGGLGKPGTRPVQTSAPLNGDRAEATIGNRHPSAPIVLREPGATPLMQAVYPLPSVSSPDVPALSVLDNILLSGRTSRLYQALFESGLAADGGTLPYTFRRGGWYDFSFTPAPGKTNQEVDAALLGVLQAARDQPPTQEEVDRARTQITARTVLGSTSVQAQAAQLGSDATTAGDYRYTDKYLLALQDVTPADVQRVAQTYLQDASRTVGYFEPTQAQAGQGQGGPAASGTQEAFNAGPPVDPAEVAKYLPTSPAAGQAQVPLPEEVKLPNGLTLLLLRDSSTPTVTLSAEVRAGREFDTEDKAGLADQVAANLLSGTTSRDELTLARTLDDVGAALSASASRFGVQIGGAALSANLPTLLVVFSDVLQHATFPVEQFKLSQAQALQGLRRSADSPASVAQEVFRKTVYPKGNPWQVFASPESVGALTQADLSAFYQAHYRPDSTVVTLVGDFDPAAVKQLLTDELGGWTAQGAAPTVTYPAIGKPAGVVRAAPDLPGKTQAVTYLGYQSIDRKDPRYYASLVLNQVLGGDTLSSRLGTSLRDQQGLTYGVSSGFSAGREAGPFTVVLQTNPRDTEKAVQGALGILGQVQGQGLTETELNTAKNTLVSGYTVGLSNPAALAGTFTGFYTSGLPLSELTQYQAKVNAVTLDQVNQAAKELLDPQNIVIVTAGPK